MRAVVALTKLNLAGSLRRQIHLATLLLALLLMGLPLYVHQFSLGTNGFSRVSTDFGLTIMNFFAVGLAIFVTSSSIPRELENRSVHTLLVRPVRRYQYILSHFVANITILGASLLLLGAAFTTALAFMTGKIDLSLLVAVYGFFLQGAVITAVCLAISTKASPALTGTAGAFVYLVGILPQAFIRFFLVEDRDSPFSAGFARLLKSIVPDLSLFNLKDAVVHQLYYNPLYPVSMTLYAMAWVAVSVLIATFLFGSRDL